MNPLDVKSLRLTAQHDTPSPLQLHLIEAELARVSMSNYITSSSSVEVTEQEPHEEQNQDSVQVNKRANPQVGRTVKPKGKDRT